MTPRECRRVALAILAIICAVTPLVLSRHAATGLWASPDVQFWFVAGGAGLCVVLSTVLLLSARREDAGEVAILAASLTVLGIFATVSGLATPGVLLDTGGAASTAGGLALPCAAAAAIPLLLPDGRASQMLARRWKLWTDTELAVALLLGAWLLATGPRSGLPRTIELVLLSIGIVGVVGLAARHLRLYLIGHAPASLVTSVAVVVLAVAAATGAVATRSSPAWWVAHTFDLAAVVTGVVSVALLFQSGRRTSTMLAPIVNRDPLVALELGLTPEIHAFIAALALKDAITRDHVVRVTELAMRVGSNVGIQPARLRALGLGAMLHDIGKLVVPSDILAKPGTLTEAEWAVMRTHPERGAALLERSSTLRGVASLVRWHHERPDGTGYPDGLVNNEIPREVAIISVCDAYDAMTNTRQYRGGMPSSQAEEILTSGAGTQWGEAAVESVIQLLHASDDDSGTVFDSTGRDHNWEPREIREFLGACTDALPPELLVDQPAPPITPSLGSRSDELPVARS